MSKSHEAYETWDALRGIDRSCGSCKHVFKEIDEYPCVFCKLSKFLVKWEKSND